MDDGQFTISPRARPIQCNESKHSFQAASNVCIFDCRNCIEGLFLSSGIIRSSDYTMDQLVEVAPLMREHRLYQADWLMRFYGYEAGEIAAAGRHGMLDLEIDPKLAWALAHRPQFPVDLNRAPRSLLLRVPGLGTQSVDRLLAARRVRQLRLDDVLRLRGPVRKALPFVLVDGHRPVLGEMDSATLRSQLIQQSKASTAQARHSGLRVADPVQARLF